MSGTDRITVAIPAKGRLHTGALGLLEAAGFQPETWSERALSLRCTGAPVDALLVRAADIPEYVQDGAVDCGITGADLVLERGADVTEMLRLGFGSCSLQAAVPEESAIVALEELDGHRVATVFPQLTSSLLAERNVFVHICEVSGSVEIAPRIGLADGIVDLVSSGGTLRTNGLRSLGTLLESEAVLVAGKESACSLDGLVTALRSVVEARNSRYLMFNLPAEALDRVAEILPTPGSPSVVPLRSSDHVAVHALVPAGEVWELLPKLQALGASSILLNPVERVLA